MNKAIRDVIVSNYQPWRSTGGAHRGPIGAAGAFPLHQDARNYFRRQGIPVEGRVMEDLLEDELLAVFDRVSSWLTPADRARLDKKIAFGAAQTHEPSPYAMPCLDGYAILFDYSFDTLLIGAMDLYCGLWLEPAFVTKAQFPLALNTLIASVFFRQADYSTPIPADDFPHRPVVDSMIWLTTVFFVAHEIGHVLLNHFDDAEERQASATTPSGRESVTVLQLTHEFEYAADRFALELMFRADDRGELFKGGADRASAWSSGYGTIGWAFALLTAVETLGHRLEVPLVDTHPPSEFRWEELAVEIDGRGPVTYDAVELDRMMHGVAEQSAQTGALPPIHPELAPDALVVIPHYDFTPGEIAKASAAGEQPIQLPLAVFNAWIEVATLDQARDLLKDHPELMSPQGEMMHYTLADRQSDPQARAHVLGKRLPLLLRAKEIGIDDAMVEAREGRLPDLPSPVVRFDVPQEQFQRLQQARESHDKQLEADALAASPELAAFQKLPDTIMALLRTTTWQDTQRMLLGHPELLYAKTDGLFDILAKDEPEPVRARIESFRSMVHRAREVGAIRAVLESRIVWGVRDQATS